MSGIRCPICQEFMQRVRDRRALFATAAMPIIQPFLLGNAAVTQIEHLSKAVLDQEKASFRRELVEACGASDCFEIRQHGLSVAQLN